MSLKVSSCASLHGCPHDAVGVRTSPGASIPAGVGRHRDQAPGRCPYPGKRARPRHAPGPRPRAPLPVATACLLSSCGPGLRFWVDEPTKRVVRRPVGDDRALAACSTSLVRKADRKSTRLNSSHVATSYAVFCLKKKRTKPDEA